MLPKVDEEEEESSYDSNTNSFQDSLSLTEEEIKQKLEPKEPNEVNESQFSSIGESGLFFDVDE
jgi:hypothetical protein